MKALFLLLLGLCLSQSASLAEKPKRTPVSEDQVRRSLERIIIPKLELREATLQEALKVLSEEARRRNPKGREITFVVRINASVTPSAVPTIPGASAPPAVSADPKLTLSLTNVPLIEALRYLTGLSNLKFWIRPDGVHIVALTEPEPMFTRDFRIPPDFFPSWEKKDRLENLENAASMKKDFRQFLIANGVVFPEGAAAILNDEATRLTVHTTEDQFELIELILKESRPPRPPRVPGPEVPKVISGAGLADTVKGKLERKMQEIILPQITLHTVSLRNAIETLKQMSIRFDTRSPRGDRGVNIVLTRQEEDPPATALTSPGLDAVPADAKPLVAKSTPLITYSATKVSLKEAVEAVARLSGYHVNMQPYAVCIQKEKPDDVLAIREFLVPPNFLSKHTTTPNPPTSSPETAKHWLVSGGVSFNSPASAVYIVRTNRLIMRDTRERLQAAQEKIEAGWRDYYAEEKAKKRK